MYPSIAKTPSAPKLESKRKKSSQGIGKSGDRYNMSATADEKANKYLGDVDIKEPEKMKVTSQEGGMSTVRKSRSKSRDKFSKDRPQASSRFEFDTGWIDMGYEDRRESEKEKKEEGKTNEDKESPTDGEVRKNDDKSERNDDKSMRTDEESQRKKKDVVVSAQSGITDYDSKTAIERSERFMRTDLGEKVRSSDESFQTGATYLKADMSKGDASLGSHIKRQWEVFSQRNGHEGVYDDVVPFHDFRQQKEQDKLNSLKDQQGAGGDKTSSQKAVTGVTNLKNQKDFMKRNFDKRFEHQLNDMKWNMRVDNDILFFLKRLFVRNLEELKKLIVAASVVLNLSKDKRDALYKIFKIVFSGQEQSRKDCFELLKSKLEEFIKEEKGIEGEIGDAGISIAESDVVDFAGRILRTSSKLDIKHIDEDDSSSNNDEES